MARSRLMQSVEREAQAMDRRTVRPVRRSALHRGVSNVRDYWKTKVQTMASKRRGRKMRSALKEKKRYQRSFGRAMGERAKYIQRMNKYGRTQGAGLKEFGEALFSPEERARRQQINRQRRGFTRRREVRR